MRWVMALVVMLGLCACGDSGTETSDAQTTLEKIQGRGKIQAGVKYDSKPFGYMDTDGTLKGFDIDLMREIAQRLLGNPDAVEFQQVLSSTRIMAIHSGSLDVVAATMTITPEREDIVDFSEPYYIAGQGVMVPHKSPVRDLAALNEKRVLFVMGTTSEENMKQAVPKAQYVGFKTSTDALSALRAGRGDALTTDDTILAGFMSGNCDYRLLPQRLSKEPYGLAFKKDPATQSFRQAVNTVLEEMVEDGTLEKLKAKWVMPNLTGSRCPS
jgi:putative glutamine transport system substrate-binding protein